MMNKEQLFFIDVLNCYINQKEVKNIDGLDWNLIYQYAKMQNLTSIVYVTCKKIIPAEFLNAFNATYASNIVQSRNRNLLNNKIRKEFIENNIDYFLVKGGEVCKLYHHPDLRTMGDTDVIVRKEDQEKADDILVNKLQFDKTTDGYEWVYYKNNFEYELHNSLVYEKDEFDGTYLNDFWNHACKDEDGEYHLDWNFHLIFLIFHIRKHVRVGIGFRQFYDVAFVCLKKELDWDYIKKTLEEIGLYKLAMNVFVLINKWFGINTPITEKEYDEEFINEVTEKIFKDGVFGHENKDNILNGARTIGDSKFRFIGRLKYIFNRVFPTKTELKTFDYMLCMKKFNYFLPIAWAYRWYYIATHKNKLNDFVNKVTISDDDIEKRKNTMDKWGI